MDDIRQLTAAIFSKYQNDPVPIDRWLRKVDGNILYIKDKGVLMYHDRELKNDNGKKSTHIWLCGVVSQYRLQGVARAMLRSMLRNKCQPLVSAHVNRKKFPEMVACLEQLGFKTVPLVLDRSADGKHLEKALERFEIDTEVLRTRLANLMKK